MPQLTDDHFYLQSRSQMVTTCQECNSIHISGSQGWCIAQVLQVAGFRGSFKEAHKNLAAYPLLPCRWSHLAFQECRRADRLETRLNTFLYPEKQWRLCVALRSKVLEREKSGHLTKLWTESCRTKRSLQKKGKSISDKWHNLCKGRIHNRAWSEVQVNTKRRNCVDLEIYVSSFAYVFLSMIYFTLILTKKLKGRIMMATNSPF